MPAVTCIYELHYLFPDEAWLLALGLPGTVHQQLTLGHLLITPSNFTTRGLLHEAMHLCKAYTVHMHILSNLWIQANVVPG